jgi:hypothetical protein
MQTHSVRRLHHQTLEMFKHRVVSEKEKSRTTHTPETALLARNVHVLLAGSMSRLTKKFLVRL